MDLRSEKPEPRKGSPEAESRRIVEASRPVDETGKLPSMKGKPSLFPGRKFPDGLRSGNSADGPTGKTRKKAPMFPKDSTTKKKAVTPQETADALRELADEGHKLPDIPTIDDNEYPTTRKLLETPDDVLARGIHELLERDKLE